MKRILLLACVAALALFNPVYAAQDAHDSGNDSGDVVDFVNTLKADNNAYYMGHKIEFFSALAKGQHPIATVITCSDSRVQTNMLDKTPEGNLFMIRNIGNQLVTAEGSVEYGVHHLHTPLLLIIGHSRCGAIAAVSGNYSKESPAIKRELDSITISKDLSNIDGVKANVNNQVAAAMLKFDDELREGKLTVIGAVLDFADDLHQGTGKLSIVNVNGETNAAKLANMESVLTKAKAAKPAKK
jgi:carbonic anhydrase